MSESVLNMPKANNRLYKLSLDNHSSNSSSADPDVYITGGRLHTKGGPKHQQEDNCEESLQYTNH